MVNSTVQILPPVTSLLFTQRRKNKTKQKKIKKEQKKKKGFAFI